MLLREELVMACSLPRPVTRARLARSRSWLLWLSWFCGSHRSLVSEVPLVDYRFLRFSRFRASWYLLQCMIYYRSLSVRSGLLAVCSSLDSRQLPYLFD